VAGVRTELFIIYSNSFEASCADAEPTLLLRLTDLHCIDELRSKFKEAYFL
jgi:hypothetical protein